MKAQFMFADGAPEGFVAIMDINQSAMSITNDAEAVVEHLVRTGRLKSTDILIYRDTDGQWDQLVHKDGKFVDFCMVSGRTMADAIKIVRLRAAR
jgi:hypothetical protein